MSKIRCNPINCIVKVFLGIDFSFEFVQLLLARFNQNSIILIHQYILVRSINSFYLHIDRERIFN